jgi:hypothetical protein
MTLTAVDRALAEAGILPPLLSSAADWPVLDDDALYGLAGEIVRVIEPHSEADPAGILVSLLVSFGALVGPTPHAVAGDANHGAHLFACLVGETSKGRKGTASAAARRVLRAADPQFVREREMSGFGSGEVLVDSLRGTDEHAGDPRLLLTEPEFARILNVARRESSTLSAIVRQAWDGGRLAARSRTFTTVADDSHVCVLGHISADELRAKLTETEVASGFANRFLFVCVRASKMLPSGGNLDDSDLAPFVRKFALFAAQARKVGLVRRTPAAEVVWGDVYEQMHTDEPRGLLGSVIGRDTPQVLRLSVTYALLDGERIVDVPHIRAAWALWRYCRASAAHIFGESIGDPIADALLRAVRAAKGSGLTKSAQSAVFSGHADRRQLDRARSVLIDAGLAETVIVETDGRPASILVARYAKQANKAKKGSLGDEVPIPVPHAPCETSERSEQTSDDPPPFTDADLERLMSEADDESPIEDF